MSDIFNSRFCLLCFLVHLLFSQGFSNLWKPSGEDKEFQSLYFSMEALGRVPRWILLRLTVPLFAQIFHTVTSKFTKKSSIGSQRKFSWIGYNLDAKTRLSFASCGPLAVEMSHKSWPGICKIFNLEGNDHLKNSPSIPLKVVWSVGEFATTQVIKCREDRSSW